MDKKEELIVQSAIRVFVKFGYSKAALEDIAAEAGISRSSIYLYFKNKKALYHRVLEYASKDLTDTLDKQLGSIPVGMHSRLQNMLSWIYTQEEGSSNLQNLFLSPGKAEDVALEIERKMDSAVVEIFEKELNSMIAQGLAELPDPLTAPKVAQVLYATAKGLAKNSPTHQHYLMHLETFIGLIKRALKAG